MTATDDGQTDRRQPIDCLFVPRGLRGTGVSRLSWRWQFFSTPYVSQFTLDKRDKREIRLKGWLASYFNRIPPFTFDTNRPSTRRVYNFLPLTILHYNLNKKSLQIVGPRPTMCRTSFLASKHNANPVKILMHLHLLCAQRGKQLGLCWRVNSCSKQSKAHSWLHKAHQHKGFIWPRLAGISRSNYAPTQFESPFGG